MAGLAEVIEFWVGRLDFGALSSDALAARWAFRWAERASFYEYIASQVRNEVILRNAIEKYRLTLVKRKRRRAAVIVADIGRRVRDGGRLATAMTPWASPAERMAIASGEASGKLPTALDVLMRSQSGTGAIKRAFYSAVYPPLIYLAAIYGVLIYIGAGFVPMMTKDEPGATFKGLGAVLVALGHFAASPLAVLPPVAAIGLVALVVYSLPRWTGPLRKRADRWFPWSYYRDINGYMWLIGFTAMLRGGMGVGRILEEQKAHSSPWLRERLDAIHNRVSDGQAFGEAMVESGFDFPHERLVDSVVATAGFSDFAERMEEGLSRWLEKYEAAMKIKADLFGLFFEVAIICVVAFIVFGFSSLGRSMASVVNFH